MPDPHTAGARLLELDRGEALFRVARDAARPFQVRIDDRVIEALGTQFNVYRRADDVLLTVVEGRVSVMSRSHPER